MRTFLTFTLLLACLGLTGSGNTQTPKQAKDTIVQQQVPAVTVTFEQKNELEEIKNQVQMVKEDQVQTNKKLDSMNAQVEIKKTVELMDELLNQPQ